ncbi:putative galacturonosyltransferase 14 [Hordeum vulgare]|nr:putative galacturonosyltransferase 14 [Hordeum vulgare]
MDTSLLPPITIEVVHAPSPRTDLVAGHVGPAVAQASVAPARKRQGNVVVHGRNPVAPAAKARTPGANAVARSRPAAEKVTKAVGGKRKRILVTNKLHPSSSHSIPERYAPAMPFNGVAPPASEVFDEMAGSGGSNDPTSEFVNLLDTNVLDINQALFAALDYNETKGGVDDHGCEDDLAKIEAEAYEQSQSKTGKSQRSKNYTILEDQALIQAWSAVSLDACTCTSQTAKRYWQRIEDQYFRIMTKTRLPNIDTKTWKLRKANSSN